MKKSRLINEVDEPEWESGYISKAGMVELVNLYHLARTALAGGDTSRYQRMLWASRWYAQEHPETTSTRAYKELDKCLSQ